MPVATVATGGYFHKEVAAETLLVSDALTVTQSIMVVGAQSGTADDLATITLHADFTFPGYQPAIYLKATTGDTITIKDGTGNIETNSGSDVSLTGEKMVMLIRPVGTAITGVTAKWICFS